MWSVTEVNCHFIQGVCLICDLYTPANIRLESPGIFGKPCSRSLKFLKWLEKGPLVSEEGLKYPSKGDHLKELAFKA